MRTLPVPAPSARHLCRNQSQLVLTECGRNIALRCPRPVQGRNDYRGGPFRKGVAPLHASLVVAAYLFSGVATRADGARRLRRFRVAQTRGCREKPRDGKLRTMKRPEGRAPAQIMVAALNTSVAARRPYRLRPG